MDIKFDGLAKEFTVEKEQRNKEQEQRKSLTQQLVEMNAYIEKLNSFRAPPPFTPEKAPSPGFGHFPQSN